MSDLAATNCGSTNCGCDCVTGGGSSNNNCLFLILILLFCGGGCNISCGGGCGGGECHIGDGAAYGGFGNRCGGA